MSDATTHKAEFYYYDIGDYLSREEKLKIIDEFGSMEKLPFTRLIPNEHGDWISMRNDRFSAWIPIEPTSKFTQNNQSWFVAQSCGILTAKDAFLYNSSKAKLSDTVEKMVDFYNEQRELYQKSADKDIDEVIDKDSTKISWSDLFIRDAKNLPTIKSIPQKRLKESCNLYIWYRSNKSIHCFNFKFYSRL